MRRLFASPPSPSLVISVLALCIAMGGASYAAFKIPASSVGTRQLRNGAVTGRKISTGAVTGGKIGHGAVTGRKISTGAVTGTKIGNGAVTGAKVSVAKFPTVPSATHASVADSAKNSVAAANAVNALNASALGGRPAGSYALARTLQPTSAFLENGWSASSGVPGYAKDQFGIVHLFGSAMNASATGANLFTLPVGFRPGYTVDGVVRVGGTNTPPGLLEINSDGSISPRNATTFVELEGITFSAGG